MKFSAPKKAILESLVHCMNVDRTGLNSITECVMLSADRSQTRITRIVPPVCIRSIVDGASCPEVGYELANAATLFDCVKNMPDGAVNLVSDGKKLTITGDKTRKYSVSTISAQDYPKFGNRPAEQAFSMPGVVLRRLIERTSYAIADESYDSLHGIYIDVRDGHATGNASDGRMVVIAEEAHEKISGSATVFLPGSARKAALAMMGSVEQEIVSVYSSQNMMHIACDAGELQFGLPSADRFHLFGISKKIISERTLTVGRSALASAAKGIMVGAKAAYCACWMTFSKDGLLMQANGESSSNSELVPTSGETAPEMCLNAHLLALSIGPISSDEIGIHIPDDESTFAITAPGTLAIISPLLKDSVPRVQAA
jgi:DNA polymerase III subunit beta